MKFTIGRCLGLTTLGALAVWMAMPATGGQDSPRVEVKQSARHAKTAALRDFVPQSHQKENAPLKVFPVRSPKKHGGGGGGGGGTFTDPVLQTSAGTPLGATAGVNFAALTSVGYVPPDPNLAVGTTQAVAIDNVDFAVYNKTTGTVEQVQEPIHAIFSALGVSDLCATTDGGDPIVLFDKIDSRWLITQLAYNKSTTDNHECVAISTTDDATGAYDVYDMNFGTQFPDYPKFGIWSDGGSLAGVYYSSNIFANGSSFSGAEFCAFPLSSMKTPPPALTWVCLGPDATAYSVLPADQEGGASGRVGSGLPELYLQFADNLSAASGNELLLYKYNVNFAAMTASLSGPTSVPVATFNEACGGGTCVPQLNTTQTLDSLGDRLMYRASFRHYSATDERLVVNQSVQLSSSSTQTGMRWYQINDPNVSPTVAQQSTYAPDTANYRWMGSIAQDQSGDLGAGYSVSSPSSFVSIGFTGQVAGDPGGRLRSETTVASSSGAQMSVNRWGDYSAISLDPSDDCTFWYTNEILTGNGSYSNWETYVASFKFPTCGFPPSPNFSLSGSPGSQTVTAGGGTSYTISVTPSNGYGGNVTLSVISGLPSGAGASFAPSATISGGSGSATMIVTTSGSTSPGSYTLTVQGTDGTLTHTTSVALVVNPVGGSGDFTISATPSSQSLAARGSTAYTVTVTASSGFNGTVSLSVSGLPRSTSASFSPSSITTSTSGTSTLTISAGRRPPAGSFTLTITGTSGALSHSTTVTLAIT